MGANEKVQAAMHDGERNIIRAEVYQEVADSIKYLQETENLDKETCDGLVKFLVLQSFLARAGAL